MTAIGLSPVDWHIIAIYFGFVIGIGFNGIYFLINPAADKKVLADIHPDV